MRNIWQNRLQLPGVARFVFLGVVDVLRDVLQVHQRFQFDGEQILHERIVSPQRPTRIPS